MLLTGKEQVRLQCFFIFHFFFTFYFEWQFCRLSKIDFLEHDFDMQSYI